MKSFKYLFYSTAMGRTSAYFPLFQRRPLATDKINTTEMETNNRANSKPEIGPSAPELQIRDLTGDHERK